MKRSAGSCRSRPRKWVKLRVRYHRTADTRVYSLGARMARMILPSCLWCFRDVGFLDGQSPRRLGYMVPGFSSRGSDQVDRKIRNGLPDPLDLLIVCIEAGSSLDQALVKTDELELASPALAEEFRMMIETRAGKPGSKRSRTLASRTGVDDVRALVAMLVQTDRFGTSVSHGAQNSRRSVANQAAAAG